MTTWEIETALYLPRISKALEELKPAFARAREVPTAPFSDPMSIEQTIAYHLALFAVNGLTVVDQLFDNIGLLWHEGRMVGVSSLVRFGLEYWAAVYFGRLVLDAFERDGDAEKALEKTARLTFSGKTPVALPWGGMTTNSAYSVLTFIDKLSSRESEARDLYDLLSEASHPSFLQNTYFIMSSRRYDNFSNEAFAAHAHSILERTTVTLEKTAVGMAEDVEAILKIALPKFTVE